MKKILLSAALLLGAFAAKADYTDYYRVYYNGEEVENGGTIVCTHYDDRTDYYGMNMGYAYEAHISFIGQTEDAIVLRTLQGYTDLPTEEEFKNDNGYVGDTYAQKWGQPSLCFAGAGEDGNQTNCVTMPFNAILPDNTHNSFVWQFHLNSISPSTPEAKYTLTTIACDGDQKDYEEIEGTEFNVTVVFTKEDAVEGIEADIDAEPEYFNLQGARVANPENGVFIVKKGNKVTKQVF